MADIAVVFHWPPSELRQMEVAELFAWHRLALERYRRTRGMTDHE